MDFIKPSGAHDDSAAEMLLRSAFASLDRVALGLAIGVWGALAFFLATALLIVKGGSPIGPHLSLLAQYFPGYTVTWTGSLLGLAYGFVSGFAFGWAFAVVRNVLLSIYVHVVKFRAHLSSMDRFLDE
jgi:hypothetical protein